MNSEKKKAPKWAIVLVLLVWIFIIICATNLSNNSTTQNNVQSNYINKDITKTDNKFVYYEDNQTLNEYIYNYNVLYPTNKITNEIFTTYYHHNSEHKNQIQFTINELDVLLTANYDKNISVYIKNTQADNKQIINLTKNFVKTFDSSISEEKIEEHLNISQASSSINTYDNIEYLINKSIDGKYIEYLKITGNIK